jgi:hypothetical protein
MNKMLYFLLTCCAQFDDSTLPSRDLCWASPSCDLLGKRQDRAISRFNVAFVWFHLQLSPSCGFVFNCRLCAISCFNVTFM